MSMKSAAHQKKVESAVRILKTTTGVKVRQAMILANFSKKDIANDSIRRTIQRRIEKQHPTNIIKCNESSPVSSDLSSTVVSSAPTNPKPKRKQIRMTASAAQQKRVNDLETKRHKSDAHKAAVRLYDAEKQKPNGMSVRQVYAQISAQYEMCPSIMTITRYAKQGLINASPIKMGPVGNISAMAYKFLCQAYSSILPIHQMNACAGENTRKKVIPMINNVFDIGIVAAGKLLDRVIRYMAENVRAEKLNCGIRWTTHQNLSLWFDSWEVFLIEYGFATINTITGSLDIPQHMKARILNMDETCMSLDGGNSNRGGRPTTTYSDVRFPKVGQATSKSALTTTMICGSNAAGEPMPPHFQFQTASQTVEAEAIRIETIRYMLDVRAQFGHAEEQSFPVSIGLNNKGGMDDDEFFEYFKNSIMSLYPDAAPVKGRWVVVKCDSGPGRLNPELLAYIRFHGFILYPGVPNTTAVTQETDQSYGPFQSAVRTNLQCIIDKRNEEMKSCSLAPWIVGLVVFGGTDPVTGLIVGSAFERGFSHTLNIKAWAKVGAVPLSRKCLNSPKVSRSIGDGDSKQQALVHLIVEHNTIACHALTMEGFNGDAMKVELLVIEQTTVVTTPHTQDRIELLSQAKAHGNIFAATGGVHLTANDIFKGIALKQRKLLREKLKQEKKVCERQGRIEDDALHIQAMKGGDNTMLTSSDLTILLTWHQHAKVATMKKDAKLAAWVAIVGSGRAPPSFKRWTDTDDVKLLEAQSDSVEMAHTAIGHLEELKKKELVIAAMTMTEEEFTALADKRKELLNESSPPVDAI